MDVILHLGAHGTAGIGLQTLMARGVLGVGQARGAYWGPEDTRSGLFEGLFVSPGASVLPRRPVRSAGRIGIRAAQAEAAGARCLVVSDVQMLGTLDAVFERLRLYPGAGARVARVAEGFGAHRLTLALGIRCYDGWWTSAIAHRLMQGRVLSAADLSDRLVTQPMRWRHVIADLAQAVPNARLVVWTFEAMAGRPDHVLQQLTGQRLIPGVARPWLPDGPDAAALARRIAEGAGDPRWIAGPGGRFMPFDGHHRAALRAQYDEDLAWLTAGAGGLAQYIDEPAQQTRAETAEGRGLSHDPEPEITRPRRVARARRKGTERPRPR